MKRDMMAHRDVVAELYEYMCMLQKQWRQLASLVVCHCTTAKGKVKVILSVTGHGGP
jgi:hypothetical protein